MPDPDRGDRVPRFARPFVVALVAAMLITAAFAWEPWPLTSFRLFSTLRIDEQTAWSATAVDADGREVPYPLGGGERGFRGFPFLVGELATGSAERRDELCRTWVEAAPELIGIDAVEVRIYRRTWRLSDRRGDEALPGRTELVYECGPGGARDVG